MREKGGEKTNEEKLVMFLHMIVLHHHYRLPLHASHGVSPGSCENYSTEGDDNAVPPPTFGTPMISRDSNA